MNLNNDVVYRRLRLGPLHQLHPGRSRSLIRHHHRLHRSPPYIEFLSAAERTDRSLFGVQLEQVKFKPA
jgi:hypothetical protein